MCGSTKVGSRSARIAFHSGSIRLATQETTHFGFREVDKQDKEKLVGEVFHSVADNYDVMNDVMSGTMHRLWKDTFVSTLGPRPADQGEPLRMLDVAGGTGDIAFRIVQQAAKELRGRDQSLLPEVTVFDINQSMLDVGEARAQERIGDLAQRLAWVQGNAEHLPFDNESFDSYTIAFGIRNVTNIQVALEEAHRVLGRGGRFMCLEFSTVQNPLLRTFYDQYSYHVIPKMGGAITGDAASYQYLVESIRQFPPQEEFKAMIQKAGFKMVTHTNLLNGVVAIHSGFKV
jgi:ubiquinone/menaquinone biosynthesis methyltransferase